MQKKQCNKCKKRFTRQWNLQRHLKSIHNISDYGKNNIVKQKYDSSTYSDSSPNKNEHARKPENKISEMRLYPNHFKYHNFDNRLYIVGDYNNWTYQDYEILPIENKKPKLTIEDDKRIQTACLILKNILPRYYP